MLQHMAWLRFGAHLFVAAILGFLYKDIGNDAAKVSGNVACLFFFVLFLFFSNAMPTVLTCKQTVKEGESLHSTPSVSPNSLNFTVPLEAAVFLREHANNWYSLSAYYLSKVLADLPFMVRYIRL